MKSILLAGMFASMLTAPMALARSTSLAELAEMSGLNTRQVQMVLGTRSAYAEYLTSYERVRKQFVEAVGPAQYQLLVQAYQQGKPLQIGARQG